uniref:Uncharacterized protein n=1 Tax=Anguilla anguilla TaxID=7936 RepID=A0A0E9V6V1_ANGAN
MCISFPFVTSFAIILLAICTVIVHI